MTARLLNVLLLTAFTYWASGAGLFVHEQLERDGEESPLAVDGEMHWESTTRASHTCAPNTVESNTFASGDLSSGALGWQPDRPAHHHDHDHCPTCQLLAQMTVAALGIAVALPSHVPTRPITSHIRACPVSLGFRSPALIRGPPEPLIAWSNSIEAVERIV